jgi:hypothetical protein
MAVFTLYVSQNLKICWNGIEVSGHKLGRKFPANHFLYIVKPAIEYGVSQVVAYCVTVYAAFVIAGR